MIITMLANFYLFVFQYFNYYSILSFQMISSANIQLFHSSPPSKTNSSSPYAICLAFMVFQSLPNDHLCQDQFGG